MHLGEWSDPRRDALATSVLALSCQKSSTFAKCETTLGIHIFSNFRQMSGHQFVCRRLLASGQSMHQCSDSFLSCQRSRLVFVEIQWTAKFDQQARCCRHSPLCFWITLEKSHSPRFRRTVWPCLFSQPIFLPVPMSCEARIFFLPRRAQTFALARQPDTAICEVSITTRLVDP